jgi:hypothetical protein
MHKFERFRRATQGRETAQSRCLIIAIVVTAVLLCLNQRAWSGQNESACQMTQIAPLADGKVLAYVCSDFGPQPANSPRVIARETVGLHDIAADTDQVLMSADRVLLLPAPVGRMFAVTLWTTGENWLYEGTLRRAKLDGTPVAWSADGTKLFYDAGSTVNADGFNILGIFDTQKFRTRQIHLRNITEHVTTCSKSGYIYTESWVDDWPPEADAYDQNGTFLFHSKNPYVDFSASCHFGVPFASAHGPADWAVFDARSRNIVTQFPWHDDDPSRQHSFEAWNPVIDQLFLMHDFATGAEQVFDIQKRAVVYWCSDCSAVSWSADGKSLIYWRDGKFIFQPIQP